MLIKLSTWLCLDIKMQNEVTTPPLSGSRTLFSSGLCRAKRETAANKAGKVLGKALHCFLN